MASKTQHSDALARWLVTQRWFASKTRRIERIRVEDWIPIGPAGVAIVAVDLDDGRLERYAIPSVGMPTETVEDALGDRAFCQAMLELIERGATVRSQAGGTLRGQPSAASRTTSAPGSIRLLGGEQSHTSMVFDERVILKLLRRLTAGINPELEMVQFLTERATFSHTPRLAGHLDYEPTSGDTVTLAIAQDFVADGRDGWAWTLNQLVALDSRARHSAERPRLELVRAWAAPSLAAAGRLGQVTAALHLALASATSDPAFTPEAITGEDVGAWAEDVRRQIDAAATALNNRHLLAEIPDVAQGLRALEGRSKIRHHGDLHLGQTLYRESTGDFMIIDFEGEPLRPLAERRRKHAALRDVAGMLRSFDYAAVAWRLSGTGGDSRREAWREAWRQAAVGEFVEGYRAVANRAPFVPEGVEGFVRAVAIFEMEKAAYEIVYEANHRPDWVDIPRRGLLSAAARASGAAEAGAA